MLEADRLLKDVSQPKSPYDAACGVPMSEIKRRILASAADPSTKRRALQLLKARAAPMGRGPCV